MTMMTSPITSQSQISTSSATHPMPNMDMRHTSTTTFLMLRVCRRLCAAMSFVWVDITWPTCTNHQLNTGTTQICHQSFLILQSWLETLTAIVQTTDIRRLIWTGSPCKSGHWTGLSVVARRQATWHVPLRKVATWLLARFVLDLNDRLSSTACLLCGSWWLPPQSAPTFSYSYWHGRLALTHPNQLVSHVSKNRNLWLPFLLRLMSQ